MNISTNGAIKKKAWKTQKDGFQDSLYYLRGRMKGEITSIKTPWKKLNEASIDGIEWHSTTVIAGRPGAGKSLCKDQLIREAFKLNPALNFRVLEFQLEMLARSSAIREYSSYLGKSYKDLCTMLTTEELEKCKLYAQERIKYPIDIIEDPCTVEDFVKIIHAYMLEHSTLKFVQKDGKEVSERTYKHTIITIDHSLLLKKGQNEKDKYDMLYNLGEALTFLKRKYPIAFIILSQLNRNIDSPDRNEDGKIGNYVFESDIFGSDALLQHADILIGLNRPGKQNIRFYGPERYIIDNPYILVFHYLKCRNGEVGLSFFQGEFSKMKISEIPTPGKQERRIKT